jgi:hypothetical protein
MDKKDKAFFTVSSILVAISLYLSAQISYSIPQFETMFISFGVEIASNAKAVIKYHYFGLILPFITIFTLIYIFKSNVTKTIKTTVYLLSLITFILTVNWQSYSAGVLYNHIYQMGEK